MSATQLFEPGKEQPRKRSEELRNELNRHNYLYYVEARHELTDREYDVLYDELKALEQEFPELQTPDSPTQRVGGQPLKEFKQFRHLVPMLSLEKAEDLRELKLFESRIQKELSGESIEYLVEPKIDGVSISVHYENGQLITGATRGDGTVGDNITANLKTLHDVPLRLNTQNPPPLLEVRGEAFMREEDRVAMNAGLEKTGEKPFANTRNATAGSLKQLDPGVVAKRPLRAVFYAIGASEGLVHTTHQEELESLAKLGFPTPRISWKCTSIEEAQTHAEELKRRESELPYDIDGVVLKINNLSQVQRMGRTAKAPASAIAYKPKHWLRQAETRLLDITVQVGRTGVLTPVAELEPVFLDGTQISRATLHNEDEIRRKDLRIGDVVIIERAGRVIPAVVRVVTEKRSCTAREFVMPVQCPACGAPVTRNRIASGEKEEVAVRCNNLQCPAQKTRRVEYVAARAALDIEALGGSVADMLVERGLVQEPLDLFALNMDALASLNLGTDAQPRILGPKNAEKILQAVERSRSLPLSRWLFALAIPNVGAATALAVAAVHDNLTAVADSQILRDIVAKAEKEDVTKQIKVGPVAARSILEFFESCGGQRTLARMKQLGIDPQGRSPDSTGTAKGPQTLAGKTFVLTGTLAGMAREAAFEAIRARGGTVANSVSRKTDYLVLGTEPGDRKRTEAEKNGVPIIDEKTLMKLLGCEISETSTPYEDLFAQADRHRKTHPQQKEQT